MFRSYTCAMLKTVSAIPVLVVSFAGLALAACGSTSTGSSSPASTGTPVPTAARTAAPTAAAVSLTCPTAAVLNAALGVDVSTPRQAPTTGNAPGDSGVSCQYTSSDFKDVVILVVGSGPVKEDFFTTVEAGEQKAATEQGVKYSVTGVSGVGDKADYITFAKGGSRTEDGILAQSSNAGIVLTVVPAVSE